MTTLPPEIARIRDEPLPPTGRVARFHGADVHGMYDRLPA
jgi:hypothetical protein